MIHIAFFLPALDLGGVESILITYANDLQQKGYRVDFVLCKSGGVLEPYLSKYVTKINLGDIRLQDAFFSLRNYLKRNTPDIFISCADFPNFMAILASLSLMKRPKLIISQQGYKTADDDRIGFWGGQKYLLAKMLYPFANKIFATSTGLYDFVIHDLKIPKEKVTILNNPIVLKDLYTKADESIDIVLPDKYIIFIGRFYPVKNIPLLLRAFDQITIPDLELVLVGDGVDFEPLKQMAATCKKASSIHFTGGLNNPYPILKNSQALISCSYSEGFPTVVMEAMAFGKTAVVTPTKGAFEILGNQFNKYISKDFEDEKAFARLIEEAINAPYPADLLMQEAKTHDVGPALILLEKIISEVYQNEK
jgi:glycosyltransferase involved in cell wall biosynthesis